MNPTPTSSPAEKRRETRRPGRGNVLVRCAHPSRLEIEGRLLDVSAGDFRMMHDCPALAAGLYVEFSHVEARGRARVVWTRIIAGSVESGFVVAED